MKKALIVGGANGIGLALAHTFARKEEYNKVYIVDRVKVDGNANHCKFESIVFDLESEDYSIFDELQDVDVLIITAGFGKLALFKDITEKHIESSFKVNAIAPIRILNHFKDRLYSKDDFLCCVMVSIAGYLSSPFFSIYSATKAALRYFIEATNIELEKQGSTNRILNVSPGSIKGTSFNKGKTNLEMLVHFAQEIADHIESKDDLFIPQYDEIFKEVLERYHSDFREEGRRSYDYKVNSGRI